MPDPSNLSKNISQDLALKSSRKHLVVVSVTLLALLFSGAQISEANTFLFKLTFTNTNGVADLLLLMVGFLLVKYYSNASKYHKAIYDDWTDRVLKHRIYYNICEHTSGQSGWVVNIAPDYIKFNDDLLYAEDKKFDWTLHTNFFFNAQIQYDLHTRNGYVRDQKIHVFRFNSPIKSLNALYVIFKHWLEAQTRYRESLEIYAPYFIAFFASALAISNKLPVFL